jgi:hypothetical protein
MKTKFLNEKNKIIYNMKANDQQLNKGNKKYSNILMKNCGFDPIFFNDMQKYVYVYEKNPMKKVYSSNAVLAIPINEEESAIKKNPKKSYVAEDKESYEQEELNKILDNNILCINPKNQNQSPIPNKNKRMSAFQETSHLNSLVQNINNDVINNNKLINTYKSKIRTKFLKIYDTNSINIQGKIKYKLFHKCCYPGCNRTFSSSGWLKAHFKEHLKQIHNSRFSLLFKKYIYNEQMNKINNKNNNFNHEKSGNNKENKIVKKTFFVIDKENK